MATSEEEKEVLLIIVEASEKRLKKLSTQYGKLCRELEATNKVYDDAVVRLMRILYPNGVRYDIKEQLSERAFKLDCGHLRRVK